MGLTLCTKLTPLCKPHGSALAVCYASCLECKPALHASPQHLFFVDLTLADAQQKLPVGTASPLYVFYIVLWPASIHASESDPVTQAGLLLLVHGEVTDPDVDFFDREKVFIEQKLKPIMDKVPDLKIVMEHITTKDAADFVQQGPTTLAASITPQHMLLNRNALFLVRPQHKIHCLLRTEQ